MKHFSFILAALFCVSFLAQAQPELSCSLDTIRLSVNYAEQRYEPMPFEMTVWVHNTGSETARGVQATVYFAPNLELAGADAPDRFTKALTPDILAPGDSGSVSWTFSHPLVSEDKTYRVTVMLIDTTSDTTWCEKTVEVPGVKWATLRLSCTMDHNLMFNPVAGDYSPNPFPVTAVMVNVGEDTADSASVYLYLPDGLELDPPGQTLRHEFGTIAPFKAGDLIPSHTWTVRWVKRYYTDWDVAFKFAGGGKHVSAGIPTDSVYAHCNIRVQGVKPEFECTLYAPDSLKLNASETGVEPNPFSAIYVVRNVGYNTGRIQRAECYFPNDGISLSPVYPQNTQTRIVDSVLAPGDSATFTWTFDVQKRMQERNLQLQVVAFDEEQNPIACERTVHIQPLKTSLSCELHASQTAIIYNPSSGKYDTPEFEATATLNNTGGFNLSNVQAEISKVDPDGYFEFDPAYPDNDNPKMRPVLFQGQSYEFYWGYRLAKDNTTGSDQYVEICVSYQSNETPLVENSCCVVIRIAPVVGPNATGTPAAGDFSLGRNYPNPFSSVTEIPYTLARDAEVSITVYNVLGQQVAELVHGRIQAGQHSARFNSENLPGGVYIVRMNAGGHALNSVMLLQR